MVKVITYGTYDLLHYGHIRLLERAKALGDYLIVGVTAEDFDKNRGKINVQQSLMERIEAVRATGLADEIIVEEYEGQKIDDIRRYDVDIFTVGSDWVGKFDYLKEYCKVVYLDRTEGVSSTEIRAEKMQIRLGLTGCNNILLKHMRESTLVNGIAVSSVYTQMPELRCAAQAEGIRTVGSYDELLNASDAVYIVSHPREHYAQIRQALLQGKHVLCESPIALREAECEELFDLARERGVVLMEAIKTAYSTAYNRLLLLLKSGKIGNVVSVDAACTSLITEKDPDYASQWNSICSWGPTALLPVLQILGTQYRCSSMTSWLSSEEHRFDAFTKMDFLYQNAVASIRVGNGVKSEGELIISGTKGYAYVPAPWWKTDYFEIRYEDPKENRRYFYQLEGEGIRYEIVAFAKSIQQNKNHAYIDRSVSQTIVSLMERYYSGEKVTFLDV